MDRSTLRQWHVWLGWMIGLPMLFWTLSGLVMVARPIEEVRGTNLLREPASVVLPGAGLVAPRVGELKLRSLHLEERADGTRWVVEALDGTRRLADPATGALLPALSANAAVREVESRYQGKAKVASVQRTDAKAPPVELRRPIETWQVAMNDGTRFYVEAATGTIVARRTSFWRIYDFFWGLHIMDLQGREDTHNPWIVGFAVISLVSTLMALVLLPMTVRRRRRRAAPATERG